MKSVELLTSFLGRHNLLNLDFVLDCLQDEGVRRRKRKNRSFNTRTGQKEQPVGGKGQVCNNVNNFSRTLFATANDDAIVTAIALAPSRLRAPVELIFITF